MRHTYLQSRSPGPIATTKSISCGFRLKYAFYAFIWQFWCWHRFWGKLQYWQRLSFLRISRSFSFGNTLRGLFLIKVHCCPPIAVIVWKLMFDPSAATVIALSLTSSFFASYCLTSCLHFCFDSSWNLSSLQLSRVVALVLAISSSRISYSSSLKFSFHTQQFDWIAQHFPISLSREPQIAFQHVVSTLQIACWIVQLGFLLSIGHWSPLDPHCCRNWTLEPFVELIVVGQVERHRRKLGLGLWHRKVSLVLVVVDFNRRREIGLLLEWLMMEHRITNHLVVMKVVLRRGSHQLVG